jgi:hypothetical protein
MRMRAGWRLGRVAGVLAELGFQLGDTSSQFANMLGLLMEKGDHLRRQRSETIRRYFWYRIHATPILPDPAARDYTEL